MKPAVLVYGGPISEKLQAASRALDESIARGDPTIESMEREAWVQHLTRLFQTDPEMSRQSLYEHNLRDKHGFLPALGHSVRENLEALGLVERKASL